MSQHPFKEIPVNKPELMAIYSNHGEAKIRAVLRKFYDRMAEDVLIGFFFTGKNLDEIAARQGDFLMRAMGASPSYTGKAPADAHTELPPILSGHFDRRLVLLEQTLRETGFTPQEIETWIGFENAFRDAIVSG